MWREINSAPSATLHIELLASDPLPQKIRQAITAYIRRRAETNHPR